MGKKDRLYEQYKLAINSRDKLTDNYHKWMTFYYVASSAILIAITTLYSKDSENQGLLYLSLLGLLICFLWNLSCKGYYYWSISWIKIIIQLEKSIIDNDINMGVYSVFSKEVAENETPIWKLNKPANISTPKLSLLFSFCAILSYLIFSIYLFLNLYNNWPLYPKIIIIVLFILLLFISYTIFLPKWAKSRDDKFHTLV